MSPDAHAAAVRFERPDAGRYGPVPIWWWSGAALTRERLRWQMERLLSQGVAQAVILNLAPTGPLYGALADDPPFMTEAWWEIFLGACEDAHELGFRFWPYDQIGFSGANLQGRLVTANPSWSGQALGRLSAPVGADRPIRLRCPVGSQALAAYVVTGDRSVDVPLVDGVAEAGLRGHAEAGVRGHAGAVLHLVYAQPRGFDYFNAEASAALFDTVHGQFERRAGKWFGTVIAGFFQDELPAMPTWSPQFAATFAAEHGYDLTRVLGALWGDPVAGAEASDVRCHYQEHRARLAERATFGPFHEWFDSRGLVCGFDQQSPAREADPVGSTRLYGDYLGLHAGYGAPGSDHWGDSKVHSSLAHAGHRPRTWLEAFHSSGWGGTLEETYDWLAPFLRRGATLYSPHAVYYSTVGGWWEWAPPSTCWRQPYWSEYGIFAGAVARLCELFTTGAHVADTVLLFPSTTMQSGVTMSGALPEVEAAGRIYHELNGTPAWYAERPGVLDATCHDYDIFDESVLAAAEVRGGALCVGGETYRNVVVPGAVVMRADVAGRLAALAEGGGRVVLVGEAPRSFVGPGSGAEFRGELVAGRISRVGSADGVPELLVHHDVWVEADVPHLLRRIGDAWVLALFAHDDVSGTAQPIVTRAGSGLEWIETTWDAYWQEITDTGYSYRPVGSRSAAVTVHGLAGGEQVQQWDPTTGRRTLLRTAPADDGAMRLSAPFRDGTVTVLVLGPDLPPAPSAPALVELDEQSLDDWELDAASLLDNDRGDFAAADRTGVLPVEVWRFDHRIGDSDVAKAVTATFGPFADVAGPLTAEEPWLADPEELAWEPACWSLSRGIEQDPVHGDSLGPKGYVPEEFLRWPEVAPGEWVAARFWVTVPDADEPLTLAVGANARATVLVDGAVAETSGDGYLVTTPIASGLQEVALWLQGERPEAIRAGFAVVRDVDAFRRPEWLEPAEPSSGPTMWEARLDIRLGALPEDSRILVGSEQPCTILVNGVEVGRQGDFDPYAERRFGRLHPYDVGDLLREGDNTVALLCTEGSRRPAVLVDSVPVALGGLGVMSGTGSWSSTRDGVDTALRRRSQQWQDPRFVSIEARPHPLPRARWLESPRVGDVVLDLVPDRDPGDRRAQHLDVDLPLGTTSAFVPTELPFTATVGRSACRVGDGRVELASPSRAGERMTLTFERTDGRRGGALLEGAVRVDTAPAVGPLVEWSQLGLAALAGEVVYRTRAERPRLGEGERVVLDLGEVRGSVSVAVDGVPTGALAWSPYRLDVTDAVRSGTADVMDVAVRVRNTLAGYLEHASPTPAVFKGQVRAGLFGPVRLLRCGDGA